MARIRTVKIGFFQNEQLAALPFAHRLLFEGLWLLADRDGRLEDRPIRIKAQLFPYDSLDVDAMLTDLAQGEDPLIVRYDVEGRRFVAVPNFHKHQRPSANEQPSVHPAPPEKAGSRSCASTILIEGKGEKGDLGEVGRKGEGCAATSDDAASPPALLTFPTRGNPSHWQFTAAYLRELETDYPGVNVLAECRKAHAWVRANGPKTARGMPAFLVRWLNKAVDWGRGQKVNTNGHVPAQIPERTWRDECEELHGGACKDHQAHWWAKQERGA